MNLSILSPDGQDTLSKRVNWGRATIRGSIVTAADKPFCDILHAPDDAVVVGMRLSSLYRTQEGLEQFLEGLQHPDPGQTKTALATSWLRFDGQSIDILVSAVPLSPATRDEWEIEVSDVTGAYSAIRIREREEKMLATILEYSPIGLGLIFLKPSGNRIISWYNKAMSRIFGYDEHELIGQSTRILFENEADYTHAGQVIKSQIQTSGKCDFTSTMLRRDGTPIDVRTLVVPVQIGKGLSFLSILEDITEREKAEKLLQESKERYREIIEGTDNLVTEVDREGRFTFVNEASRKIFGIDPAGCIGQFAFDFVYPEDRERTLRNFNDWLCKKKKSATFENRQMSITGGVRDMLWTIKFYYDQAGDISSIKSIARDISDLKKAYSELRRSEEKYSSIFQESPIGIFHYTGEGVITESNKKFAEIIGTSRENLVGFNMLSRIRDKRMIAAVTQSIQTGLSMFQGWYTSVTGNKTSYMQIQFKTIRDKQDQTVWGLAIVEDITEKKRAEEELHRYHEQLEYLVCERTKELEKEKIRAEAANRAKSEFLANISHEIRTPLNAVTGFSELLSSLMADEKQKSYLKAIKSAGKSLILLINNILDLSKIEAEKLEIHYSTVDLKSLLKDIQQIFELAAAKKGIEFKAHVPEDLPAALLLDEIRLRQVLLNILGNAVKFTEKGYIRLTVESLPNETGFTVDIHIRIEDTGIGIPEQDLETIFESFQQQTHLDSTRYGGTGLGLTICKRLLEMMNGGIRVESQPGKGSTFTIIMKRVTVGAREPDVLKEAFHLDDFYFNKGKVLVVDDIESNRHFLKELLEKVNLDVLEAQNGQEAILIAPDFQPDVILMDIRMPVMDGVTALACLKKDTHTRHVPVFAISTSSSAGETSTMLTKGFYGCIPKPVDVNRLLRELSKLLPLEKKDSLPGKPDACVTGPLSGKAREKLPRLVHILESDYHKQWELFQSRQPIHEVKTFAKGLITLGDTCDIGFLKDYGKRLALYVDNYDVNKMTSSLKDFPDILAQLKSVLEEEGV